MLAPQFPEYLFTRSTVAEEIGLDPVLAVIGSRRISWRTGTAGGSGRQESPRSEQRAAPPAGPGAGPVSGRPVCLLDEPTAALDRAGRDLVLDLLDRIPAGTALVIASHDRAFLAAAGCRILELVPRV